VWVALIREGDRVGGGTDWPTNLPALDEPFMVNATPGVPTKQVSKGLIRRRALASWAFTYR